MPEGSEPSLSGSQWRTNPSTVSGNARTRKRTMVFVPAPDSICRPSAPSLVALPFGADIRGQHIDGDDPAVVNSGKLVQPFGPGPSRDLEGLHGRLRAVAGATLMKWARSCETPSLATVVPSGTPDELAGEARLSCPEGAEFRRGRSGRSRIRQPERQQDLPQFFFGLSQVIDDAHCQDNGARGNGGIDATRARDTAVWNTRRSSAVLATTARRSSIATCTVSAGVGSGTSIATL